MVKHNVQIVSCTTFQPRLLPLIVLGAALFVGFTLSLMQYYVSIAEVLLVLTGLGLMVAVPVLIALVHVIRTMVTTRLAARNLEQQQEHLISSRSSLASRAMTSPKASSRIFPDSMPDMAHQNQPLLTGYLTLGISFETIALAVGAGAGFGAQG